MKFHDFWTLFGKWIKFLFLSCAIYMRWPSSCFEMTSLRFPSRWKYLLLWCLVLDVITCMHSLCRIWVDCTTNGRFSRCELAGRLHCVGAHHSGLLELQLSLFPALLGSDRFCFHIMCIVGQARWCFIRSIRSHLVWVIYTIFLLMINNLWRWDPKSYFKKISSIASCLWAYTTFSDPDLIFVYVFGCFVLFW